MMNEDYPGAAALPAAVSSNLTNASLGGTAVKKIIREPFVPDRTDGYFAIAAFVLGFFFARWVFAWQGWGVTLFTFVYGVAVALYLRKKGALRQRAGWFWFAVMMLTGLSYSLWPNYGLDHWDDLLLFGSATYWIISATNLTLLRKTSDWLPLDGLNTLLLIPFKNFGIQYSSIAYLSRANKTKGSQLLSIGLGLLLTVLVGVLVIPLLMAADSGGFAQITQGIFERFTISEMMQTLVQMLMAIPIAAYLFGLIAGSAHKRGTNSFKQEHLEKTLSGLRVLPAATVYTLLSLLSCLYIVFMASQLPYFFSAFLGERPEGWMVYSEYARSGFFELCRLAAINLTVLTASNLFSQKLRRESLGLKLLNVILALLTILLIATAFSKMALYIGVYGLTMRRLLPCLFMIFLAIVCGGVIALQKWQFSIMRLAATVGVTMLCTFCLVNSDALVARYNAERYLSSTLTSLDVDILYQTGPAGAAPALAVYEQTADASLRADLEFYLRHQRTLTQRVAGRHTDSWQNYQVRGLLENTGTGSLSGK
ncbi:MAG: DUF4173 domain-containing protein [Clostridia bacterium]|jgi:hypothetical protein|nr:DUF4173 domain-containing protein [Clostridia bacterium]